MNTAASSFRVCFSRPLRRVRVVQGSGIESNDAAENQAIASAPATQGEAEPEAADNPIFEELANQLFSQLHGLETSRGEAIKTIRLIAVELAVAVASKILFQEIASDQFPVQEMVNQLIKNAGDLDSDKPVKIQLHPLDLERLQAEGVNDRVGEQLAEQFEKSNKKSNGSEYLEWIANADIGRGNAQLDSTRFSLFYNGAIQLREIRQGLMEMLADAENERRKNGGHGTGLGRFPDRRASG